MSNKKKQIENLATEISKCTKCNLSKLRSNIVVGSGLITSKILFIGEAPGLQEDKQGVPFVGRAGKLFDMILQNIDLSRKNVYITNILKCRPPKNRNPTNQEIHYCTPFLEQQITIIQPDIIAPMGNFATRYCCKKFDIPFDKISKMHGKKFRIKNLKNTSYLMPLYHPAAAIYNPNLKQILISDIIKIKNQLSTSQDYKV